VVIMKPDGAVTALLGGVDYQSSVFDRAIQARRQPGSAFKPFVYLTALEQGISPWDTRDDEAVNINGYKPQNFGGRYYGTLTLADALAHSVNTITVNLGQEVGIKNVVATARRVGITSPLEDNASLALGTSEMAAIASIPISSRKWMARTAKSSTAARRPGRNVSSARRPTAIWWPCCGT
jgi:penicillin-binding protein 1A